ncbi:hypothetical protein V4F39_03120 [Aquincola sp. MAHUQ-54]|uniref:Capsule assembly protein Wzi n=1 Tax=Aquincola agrisoli TaxID=3119538 RepID=A0AAW9QCB7_9BURK
MTGPLRSPSPLPTHRSGRPPTAARARSPKLALAALAAAAASPAWAQPAGDGDAAAHRRPAAISIGFERITLPKNEGLGLVGTSYLLHLTPNLVIGPAAYGALTGERGGLFTIGGEVAWHQPLGGRWSANAGFYAGGGGGGVAPVGSGLMLRPHVDLLARFGPFRGGLSWSRVSFPSGDIGSTQLGFVLLADTGFGSWPGGATPASRHADGVGLDRVVAVAGVYRPSRSSTRVSGTPMERSVGYVGARFEREFSPGLLAGLETNGAASGGAGGYAEYLGTLAAETGLQGGLFTAGARLGLGMSGGGDVSTGGGFLAKAAVYGNVRLSPSVSLGLEGGLARAPDGRFKASFGAVNLNWQIDGRAQPRQAAAGPAPATRMEWVAGVERYQAARRDGSTRPLENVVLKANRFVGDTVYLTAQVHSAYGGGAGGYTVGLIGAGVQSPAWAGWRAGGEFIVGAGGGGGVDTEGGALLQPTVYVDRALGRATSARLSVGRIDSARGRLGASVAELSFVYTFGVAGAR